MLGVVFKIMHWPGAGAMLLVGYIMLIFIFLPILLIIKIKNAKQKKEKWIFIIGFSALFIFGISSMFKMFHWPGAAILMLFGGLILISIFLPLYTWRWIQLEGKITGKFVYSIILSMFMILFFMLMSLNVSTHYFSVFIDHGNYEKTISTYLEKKNVNILNEIELQADSLKIKYDANQISQKADLLCEYITNLQINILSETENTNVLSPQELLNSLKMIKNKDNIDIVNSQLIGKNKDGKAKELKEKLINFKSEINIGFNNNHQLISLTDKLLDTSNQINFENNISWEQSNFENISLINAISKLNELQSKVRIVEVLALNHINEQINY